ncbi:MAG TPA: hypothetical protein VHR72_02355 [Gemmataceae bacterium]|jgi:hypothetical protein|nr:hypothetical protein [Gemmataceae bacterium]
MRAILAVFTALCCNGCIGLAAWPCVDVTPPVQVGADDVRAKVCDLRNGWGEFGTLPMTGCFENQSFSEVPVKDGMVARQVQFREGHFVGLLLVHFCEYHDMKLVLERPGYETEVIDSWPWWFALGYAIPETVKWKKLSHLDELLLPEPRLEIDRREPVHVKIGVPSAATPMDPPELR